MTPRPASSADTDALIALWQQCGLIRPWNDPGGDIERCLNSTASCLYVCDRIDSTGLAASVMVGGDGHRGWLYYLAVVPVLRRQGLGRLMVETAELWLAEQGLPKSMLMIRIDNAAVRDFYHQLGYHDEPRQVMARWLDGRPPPEPVATGEPRRP